MAISWQSAAPCSTLSEFVHLLGMSNRCRARGISVLASIHSPSSCLPHVNKSMQLFTTSSQLSTHHLPIRPGREVDLTDCCGITDAALLELSKYQRVPPRDEDDDDDSHLSTSTPVRGRMPVHAGSAALRGNSKGSLVGGSSDEENNMAAEEVEEEAEELLFDMDATSTPTAVSQSQQQQHSSGRPPLPSVTAASRMPSRAVASTAWVREGRDEDDNDDDDLRRAKLASLAQLASSPNPLSSSFKSGSLHHGLAIPSSSPPSSLMTPDRALGSQMQRLGLGSGAHPRLRPESICGSAGSGGWVGTWERASSVASASAIPGTSATAAAAYSLGSSAGGSPPDSVGSAKPNGGLMAMYSTVAGSSGDPAPRMTMAIGRGLRSVVLAGCSQISSDGVRLLLSAPGRKACLEALDISRCYRITRHALMVPPGVRDQRCVTLPAYVFICEDTCGTIEESK